MTGSIDPNGKLNPATSPSLSPAESASDVSTADQILLSYSNEISTELIASSSDSVDSQSEQVVLDTPEIVTGSSAQVLPAVELTGLKEVVKLFNEQFDIATLDMADTASVLLIIKGMVSDMRTLSGAENVDSAQKAVSTEYVERLRLAEDLVLHQNELSPKKALLTEKQNLQLGKANLLAEKELALADADGGDEQLEGEIAALQDELGLLQTEISALDTEVVSLTATIQSGLNRLSSEVVEVIKNIFSITEGIRKRTDNVSLVTGEEQRVATRELNSRDGVVYKRTIEQLRADKTALFENDKKQIDDQNSRNEQIESERGLEKVLNRLGVTIPDGVLGLFSVTDKYNEKLLSGGSLKDMPDDKAMITVAKTLEAILAGRDPREASAAENRPLLAKLSQASSVEESETTVKMKVDGQLTEVQPDRETAVQLKAEDHERAVNDGQNQIVANAASYGRVMAALSLESAALSLVAKAEEERLKMQESINKNSPV